MANPSCLPPKSSATAEKQLPALWSASLHHGPSWSSDHTWRFRWWNMMFSYFFVGSISIFHSLADGSSPCLIGRDLQPWKSGTNQTEYWCMQCCTVPQTRHCPLAREDRSLYSRNASACAGCQKPRLAVEPNTYTKTWTNSLPEPGSHRRASFRPSCALLPALPLLALWQEDLLRQQIHCNQPAAGSGFSLQPAAAGRCHLSSAAYSQPQICLCRLMHFK